LQRIPVKDLDIRVPSSFPLQPTAPSGVLYAGAVKAFGVPRCRCGGGQLLVHRHQPLTCFPGFFLMNVVLHRHAARCRPSPGSASSHRISVLFTFVLLHSAFSHAGQSALQSTENALISTSHTVAQLMGFYPPYLLNFFPSLFSSQGLWIRPYSQCERWRNHEALTQARN
jgi:hypothetical protein